MILSEVFKEMRKGKECVCEGTKYKLINGNLHFFQKITNTWVQEFINDTFIEMMDEDNWQVVEKEKTLYERGIEKSGGRMYHQGDVKKYLIEFLKDVIIHPKRYKNKTKEIAVEKFGGELLK